MRCGRVVHGGGRASPATNARPTRWATRVHRSGCLPGRGQPGEVELIRRLPVQGRMGSARVVEGEVRRQARTCCAHRLIGLEVHLLVLDASPQPLDEDVVAPGTLAVHAGADAALTQNVDELDAGELA